MVLLINTSLLRFGGAVQVALSFINECKHHPGHTYHVLVGPGVGKSLKKNDFPSNFFFYDLNFGPVALWKIPSIAFRLSRLERRIGPDCVVTTSGPSYWHTRAPHLMGYNLPLYIYRESPYFRTVPFYRKLRPALKKRMHLWFFKRDATAYLVQTDDVGNRVKTLLKNDHVFTVSNTYSHFFTGPLNRDNKLPGKKGNEIRLFTPTSYYAHKNLEIIPLVSNELKNRHIHHIRFILTLDDRNFIRVAGGNKREDIVNIGPLKPEECPPVYRECDFMFLPTLAECFSAAYPEAMVMKRPVITTDLAFARNICGDAALYYRPMDPASAADAITQLINDRSLQKTLIKKGTDRLQQFDTAGDRARKIIDICRNLSQG